MKNFRLLDDDQLIQHYALLAKQVGENTAPGADGIFRIGRWNPLPAAGL